MSIRAKWLGLALVAATTAAACDQSPTAVAAPQDLQMAALVVPGGAAFQVTVCKQGPAGTYNFTASANTGSVTLPYGGSFTLAADECKTVATTTGSRQSVTIVESTPPAGTLFDAVDVYEYFTGTGQTTLNRTEIDPEVTLYPFGNDRGLVVVYRNIRDPETGCTLTQGYWKTHSEFGPAPYNDTWASLSSGAATTFYSSGQSWLGVFWTAPAGNAYYNLAHQYMAAYLNIEAGAGAPAAVTTAMASAVGLFGTYTPAQIAPLKGSNATRQLFLSLAGTLGDYNEGITGPGHCGD